MRRVCDFGLFHKRGILPQWRRVFWFFIFTYIYLTVLHCLFKVSDTYPTSK